MFWKILGIEPTKDKKVITQAYREKLMQTNPEEKPEEFKELRNAYEEALKYAENQGLKTEKTPVDLWRDKLEELYNDFPSRNDLSCWQRLFNEDVCLAIDTRMDVEDAMMNFFMDHYFITHDVWVYLDTQFSLLERQEELYEKYPKDFIDYVIINGIIHNDTLPMNMFYPGVDGECCHKYLGIYLQIRRLTNEEARPLFEELMALPEQHPYGDALYLSFRIKYDDKALINDLADLCNKYPDDTHLGLVLANDYFYQQMYEECCQHCESMIKRGMEPEQLKWTYANALANLGMYDEGITQINELMRASDGDNQKISNLNRKRQEWNVKVIEQKEEYIKDHPEDDQAKLDLSWAYLENDNTARAAELAWAVRKENVHPFDYYNLSSNIAFAQENKELGMEYLDNLIEVIKNLPDDGDEKTVKRKARLGEMYARKGYYYYSMFKDMDKAMEAFERSLEISNDKSDVLTQLTQISLAERKYEKAKEYAVRLTKANPDAYHRYLLLAYACFYLEHDREAYDAVNKSLDLNRSDLGLYILKIRILIRNRAYDEADEVIGFLLDNNLQDDGSVMYTQGLLRETRDKDYDEAVRYYENADKALGEYVHNYSFGADLYYRLLCLRGEKLNGSIKEDRDIMMELADKGLKCDSEHHALKDYKAWLLLKDKQYEESLKIYKELSELPNHPASVDAQIGYIYYQDLEHDADLALEYYLKSLQRKGDQTGYFYAGMCCMYMGNLDDAEKYFLKLQEYEPDKLDSYFRLSFVYEMKEDLNKALENINKVIKIVDLNANDNTRYYYQKVMILRRLGKYDEAVELVKEMVRKFNYKYGNNLICKIYLQAGRYEDARKWLASWKKVRPVDNACYSRQVTLDILESSFLKAKFDRANFANQMDRSRSLEFEHLIALNDGDYKKEIKVLEKLLEEEGKKKGDVTKVLGNLAYACFHRGDRDKQVEYAEKAIKQLDLKINEYGVNGLLYKTRKVRALALAGRIKEAFKLIDELRTHSLCESCPYRFCKDLECFEMEVHEIAGDMGMAYELAVFGAKRWPDEESFVIMANVLKKKVK